MFESRADAERVQSQLEQLGIIDTDGGHGIHDQNSPGFSKDQYSNQENRGFWGGLKNTFLPDEDRHTYEEGVRRGHFLLTVNTDAQNADRVHQILESSNAVDVDEKSASWKSEGWTPPSSGSSTGAGLGMAAGGSASAFGASSSGSSDRAFGSSSESSDRSFAGTTGSSNEQRIPVVEEQLSVGKREVNRGGVRVRSYFHETPVQEQINLREEHVHVERHAVNQPLGAANLGADAFQERDIELTEMGEEAVVAKNARVVEEVVVSKDVENRNETISDTVRRTDVDVEQLGDTGTGSERAAMFNRDGSDKDDDRTGLGSERNDMNRDSLGTTKQGSDYNR
jgi:uncharacterized protein (TIGR02271 family)